MTLRKTKRESIYGLFRDALGTHFDSYLLHQTYGSSFRSRVSEINNGNYDILIINRTDTNDRSTYYAIARPAVIVAEAA